MLSDPQHNSTGLPCCICQCGTVTVAAQAAQVDRSRQSDYDPARAAQGGGRQTEVPRGWQDQGSHLGEAASGMSLSRFPWEQRFLIESHPNPPLS